MPGLRCFTTPQLSIHPPTLMVSVPDDITYDGTYSRGMDSLVLPVLVMVGKADAQSAYDRIFDYLDGDGPTSIKTLLESGNYTAMDSVHVSSAACGVYTFASVSYLGAEFTVEIHGRGE